MKTAGEILKERQNREITVADLIEFLCEAREDMRKEVFLKINEHRYDPPSTREKLLQRIIADIRAIENK